VSNYTFTSESVTEGHPDKMADQISDAILDALLEQDPMSRVACETMVTTGLAFVAGEISTNAYVDIPSVVRSTITRIGYDNESYGFDGNTCGVMVAIDEQSVDIAQGVDKSEEVRGGTASGGLPQHDRREKVGDHCRYRNECEQRRRARPERHHLRSFRRRTTLRL
jgi:S-adenosylmethionine synthetase